jgi:uncharacterized membrane protein
MIYILSAIGLVLFNMFLFRRNAYYEKHATSWDMVSYIKEPLLRLLVLLLCLVPFLGPLLTILHIIFTIISYIEVANRLPNTDETRLGKLNKFLDKWI